MKVISLDYAPYDYQKELHYADSRFNVVVGGRRVGKSKMALQELVRHCLETPGADAWWVAPTLAMSREVGFEEFKDYKDVLAPALENVNDTLMRVRFVNGSVLYFKGGDNEKSLRGRGLTYVVVDEAAFLSPEIWNRAILPALADRKGRALLISTPNGRNWFYDLALYASASQTEAYGQGKQSSWSYYHWPSYKNPLLTEEELESIAASVSETDYRQEFLAEFITRGGMVYEDFDQDNVVPSFTPSKEVYQIALGIDFGYANPTAVAFMAIDEVRREVIQFDELYVTRTSIAEIEQLICEKLYYHDLYPADVKRIYTDPSGNSISQDLAQGISPVDHLRMSELQWRVTNKKSLIAPGLALVRSFIKASNGVRRFFVTENCKNALRSLTGYAYADQDRGEFKEEPLKDGEHDHMCDAIRYFFVNEFDQARYVASTPEMFDYTAGMKPPGLVWKRCQGCKRQFRSRTPKTQPPFLCKQCEEIL